MKHPALKYLLVPLIALGVLVALNALAWRRPTLSATPREPSPTILKWQKKIEQTQPEIVMVGNSTLSVNIDSDAFSVLTKTRATQVASPGAASAWEYLVLKNIILRSAHKPATVVFFFRDHFLTDPAFRVRGFHYGQELQNVSLGEDLLLERLAYLGRKDPLSYFLYRYVPLFRQRDAIKKGVETAAKERMVGLLTGQPGEAVEAAIGRTFANDKVDQQSLTIMQQVSEDIVDPARYRFEREVKDSFLPTLIKLARDNGIQPWFVRIRSRRDAAGQPPPPPLAGYLAKLRAWLTGQGVTLIDLSDAEALKLSYFADGDHINPAGRTLYTQILAERFITARNPASEPSQCQFLWDGAGSARLAGGRLAKGGEAGGAMEYPFNAYFEAPGRYELTLGVDSAPGALKLWRDGAALPLTPCALPTDPTFAGRREGRRTELEITPAESHGMAALRVDGLPSGSMPPAFAWRLIEPAWSPVSASFDLAPARQWAEGERTRLGVALKVRAIQCPGQAIRLYLIDTTEPGKPREVLSCEQNYHYINGRMAKAGDIRWVELPPLSPGLARQLAGRTVILGAMPLVFPGGIGASKKEPYACPPQRLGPLGLYVLGAARFTEQAGKVTCAFTPPG